MNLRDAASWEKAVAANTDGYGACVMRYAERWADLMEERMSAALKTLVTPENPAPPELAAPGMLVATVAEVASHDADTEGITGFMYGCAVSILASVWEHGEALRRWHNLAIQLGREGEKANESGAILNPALLSIG